LERHWKQRATGIQWRIGQLFPLIGFFLCLGGERSPLRIGKSLGFACFYERHWKRRATGVQYRIGQLFVLIGFFSSKSAFRLRVGKGASLIVFLAARAAASPMMASPDGLPGIALDNGGQFLVCGIASKPAMSHNRQAGQQRRDHGRAAGNRHRIRRIGASRWPGGAASALRRLARRLPMSPAIGAGRIGLDNKGYRGQAVWRESLRLSRFLSGSRVR